MICADCANGASVAAAFTGTGLRIPPDMAAIVEANHDRCRTRNTNREVGQLPGCMCQHDHRAVNAEPEDVTHGR